MVADKSQSTLDAIIRFQIARWQSESSFPERQEERVRRPIITVSRQRGTEGVKIAKLLAGNLDYILFHREIIERICDAAEFRDEITAILRERSWAESESWLADVISGRYSHVRDYALRLGQVIYALSCLGGVVVVGRGANFILGRERGFHIRVVAPAEVRIKHLMRRQGTSRGEAAAEIDRSDKARAQYIKDVFDRSIDDPQFYDLVINNLSVDVDLAAQLIGVAVNAKFNRVRVSA